MQKQKGFTIIELIVVIAIIAVLAAIVLINVTQYINKSKDGAMKENMHALQTNAIANATGTSGSTYADSCSDAVWTKILTTYTATAGAVCAVKSTNTLWCSCVVELAPTTPTYYCVDSSGAVIEATTSVCTVCFTNGQCVAPTT